MPYSGCEGNPNNFKTMEECNAKCGKKSKYFFLLVKFGSLLGNSIKQLYGFFIHFPVVITVYDTGMVMAIAAAQKKSQCWFGNKTYSIGESIPDITNESPCSTSCFCAEGYPNGKPPRIVCAMVDCQPYPSGAGCVPVRNSESDCCSEYYCPGSKN